MLVLVLVVVLLRARWIWGNPTATLFPKSGLSCASAPICPTAPEGAITGGDTLPVTLGNWRDYVSLME